jgi:hypothetical protein
LFREKRSARRNFALAALAALGLFAFQVWAKPVARDEAASAVGGWLKQPGRGLAAHLGDTVKETRVFTDAAGQASFYVVYLKPSGFIIVPADDLVEPIIAFAPAGEFVNSDSNPLGALVRRDVPARVASAQAVPKAPAASPHRIAARAKWAQLNAAVAAAQALPATGALSVTDLRVAPLIQTTWSEQTVLDLYPGLACYNYYVPPGPNGSQYNYPCGCVATAMAQLMYFWRYPTAGVGTGSFTIYVTDRDRTANLRGGDGAGGPYPWSSMVASPTTTNITLAQRQAIGALCYDAGVSVGMDYNMSNSGQSGASLSDAAFALQNTFMYSNVIQAANDYISDSNIGSGLVGMINPNLDAGLPVILGITGPIGGHAVVADGYGYDGATLYHHLNMGWSGSYDAWYNLPNVNAGPDVFNVVFQCLYNIYMTGNGEIISGRVVDAGGGAISGVTVSAVGTNGTSYSATATTNTRGIYSFAKVPSSGTFTLTASAPNRYFIALTKTTGTSADDVTISGNVWGADFVNQAGNLRVTLRPAAAVTAGARWNVDGGDWQISGATVAGLSLGGHTVNFNTVAGWNSPASAPANIAFNATATATGVYVPQTGDVQVTLEPAGAVTAGAQWTVDGGAWQDSGATLTGVAVGSHTVNFKTVYGWDAPSAAPVTVANNALVSLSELYTVQLGDLKITLLPAAAASAGAQWRVDGGAWQNSGDTVSGLVVAAHAVDYRPILAWAPPPGETVNVSKNQTASLTRTYVVDATAPSTSGLSPVADAWSVSCDGVIALHVADAGAGVDASTVTIQASRDDTIWETIYSGATAAAGSGGWLSYSAASTTFFKGEGYSIGAPADCFCLFQPDAPFDYEQTVYVHVSATDRAGNAMPTYSYSFTTGTRSFGYPVRVDGGTAGNDLPAVATDSDGNVWVAWMRTNSTTGLESILLAERTDDAWTFGTEIAASSAVSNPVIAIAQNGTIYLAWTTQQNGGPSLGRVNVASATTTAPASWNSLGVVSNGTLSLEAVTAMAVDSLNNLYVAGLVYDSNLVPQIAVGELPSGSPNWTVTQITSSAGSKGAPAIARDASDVIYLVWANAADNNLCGADSSSWGTIHAVTNAGDAESPAIATESSGNVLHFAWTATGGAPNPDIRYAKTTGGWPATPLAGTSVLDGTTGTNDAANPKVAVTGAGAAAKVFVVWQDRRSTTAGDTDIMFAETKWDGAFGANVFVSRSLTDQPAVSSRKNPALGLTNDGTPYVAWTDEPTAGAGHIYFAAAMQSKALGSSWQGVTPAGGAHSFTDPANRHFTQVDLNVPANALSTPRNISVSELRNPVEPCPGGTGLYPADGSGLYLAISGGADEVLNGWITVTIHLTPGVNLPSPMAIYRLVPPPTELGGWTWTNDWLRNVSYDPIARTLTFQTMHLSTFAAGAAPVGSSSGGSGGGGGCSMSPCAEPDLFMFLLPLAALGLWIAARPRRLKSAR